MLFKRIGNVKTNDPLIVSFESDQQRAMIVFGENMWQWRMNSYQKFGSFNRFDDFLNRIVQFLVSKNKTERLKVEFDPIYFAQEPIRIKAILIIISILTTEPN